METWAGILFTAVSLIIGINQYRINDVIKTLSDTTKRLDERISKESTRVDTELGTHSKHYLTELNGVAERLGSQIKSLSDSVLYRDVFQQHEKAEDARYIGIEKVLLIMEKQIESTSTANTSEHNRIIKKMDTLTNEITRIGRD